MNQKKTTSKTDTSSSCGAARGGLSDSSLKSAIPERYVCCVGMVRIVVCVNEEAHGVFSTGLLIQGIAFRLFDNLLFHLIHPPIDALDRWQHQPRPPE